MAITYNDLYLDVRQRLRESGVEASTLEARELVCFGTGKSREELARDSRLYASPEREAANDRKGAWQWVRTSWR